MPQAWIAFILLCNGATCDGKRTYDNKASYSYEACRQYARGWALQMFALTKRDLRFWV